jgi:hypothetical protein
MAFTQISNIINPEVLADQITAKFPDMLVLGNSNLVEVDSTFPLGSPGTKFKLPFWKRIAAFGDMTEGTPLVPGTISASAEYCTVVRGGAAFEVLDTSELVSKADPVGEVSTQLGRRAAEYIDAKLVLQLELTPNTFDQTNAGVQTANGTNANGVVDQNVIISAMVTTLGDNHQKLLGGGAIIMHSKVYGDLLKTGAIQNQYQSGLNVIQSGVIPTLLGLPIVISDLVTAVSVSSTMNYHTFIVGPGSLALFYQRQVMVEFDRDILLQADVIASTVHFAPHLFGYDDNTTAVVAEQAKSIHVVRINSK